jgi:N-acetylmuramoyl-L-alanine amidase
MSTRGFFTFAQGDEYVRMAYALALSLKASQSKYDKLSIGITEGYKVPDEYVWAFDKIVEIPWGDDAGKIGINDALEKDINLQIALKLQKILEQNNIKVVMTRNTDAGLYSEGATNKKAEDMQKRCKIIEDSNALFTVSIHQNSYTSPEIQGAQVFYYGQSENGKKLAEILQTALIEQVDPDNHRAAKANESYYLLKKTPTPTVIVECGFLSNPIEAELLLQDDYQDQLVNAIYTGIKTYLGDELPQNESS